MKKHSICKCSNTPEAKNFTSKGQAHVHCPCEKCEDKAVYPMVASRHIRKREGHSDDNGESADLDYADAAASLQPEPRNSSDCVFSVSNYHAEFSTCSSSLLMAASRTDVDKADESEVADIDGRYLSDVDVCSYKVPSYACYHIKTTTTINDHNDN